MKSNIFTQAHQLTKQIIKSGDDYRATFALALKAIFGGLNMSTINNKSDFRNASYEERKAWINSLRKEVVGTEEEVKAVNAVIDAFVEEMASMTSREVRRARDVYSFIVEAMKLENKVWLVERDPETAAIFYPEKLAEFNAGVAKEEAEAEARRKEREEADIEARAERNDGFPELKGTVKQVAWANDIRRAMCTLKHIGQTFDDVQREALKSVNRAKTAKYWIDNYRTVYKKYQ